MSVKRTFLIGSLLLLLCASAHTEQSVPTFEARLTYYTTPLLPKYSEFTAALELGVLSDMPVISSMIIESWYLTNSLYLSPLPFFELGGVLLFDFIQNPRVRLAVGVGTALDVADGDFSAPLVATVRWHTHPFSALRFGLQIDYLQWHIGMGGEVFGRLTWFFSDHIHLEVKPGFTVYNSSAAYFGPKIGIVIGYHGGVGR